MSKRTTKFLSLLALVTALLSAVFILVSFFVDAFAKNETASLIFEEFRTAFDLIAEYTAFGIIIYAFCRYSFKNAKRSILIALGSFVFSFLFQLIATGFLEYFTREQTAKDFWINRLLDTGIGLIGFFIERIIPCALIVLITYFFTRKGTQRIKNVFSFRNPIQKSMFFSALTIYLLNLIPALIAHIIELINVGGTQNLYFEEFMMYYIIPHIFIFVYYLVLTYLVFLGTYFICNKFAESAPIKKTKKLEIASATGATPSEE